MERLPHEVDRWDLVITTYGHATRWEWLRQRTWNFLIIDEAQAIKNPQAQQTFAIKQIPARVKFALTGTPIENSLMDLWSIFDFCCPGLLQGQDKFREDSQKIKETGSYDVLRTLIQPFLLRRKKTDKAIISDLPDKIEMLTHCRLSREQVSLYRENVKRLQSELKNSEGDSFRRKGLILSYLLRFKQICNHPSQLLGDGQYDYEHSGKFFVLRDLVGAIAERKEKVLVFTQFREMTDILDHFFSQLFGQKGCVLHGGTPVHQRQKFVEDFQTKDHLPYFVLSLKAGGSGLNLTRASHVIHFDRWWNPAVENQATDRAFRIGQTQKVLVHKLICAGTIEEKIESMMKTKTALSEALLDEVPTSKLTDLTDEELLHMVDLSPVYS